MRPRAMEVATITDAVWNGDGFYMPADEVVDGQRYNSADLKGAFGIDTAFDPTANPEQGKAYEFLAVVMKKPDSGDSSQPAPRRLGVQEGSSVADSKWIVYPLTLSDKVVTTIDHLTAGREVLDVTYTDVSGRISKRPFPDFGNASPKVKFG